MLKRFMEKAGLIRHSERIHHMVGHTHGVAHLAYFAAVGVEAHGMYGIMGGVLFALGVVSYLLGMGDA